MSDQHVVGRLDAARSRIVIASSVHTINFEDRSFYVDGNPCPYLGLASFTFETRGRYAGREDEANESVRLLTRPGDEQVLFFITGASGSGKSSFAQAGLLP